MDGISWLRFVLSFAFVLGLIGLCALALRKWGGRFALPQALSKGPPRLSIVEACVIAPRQRLLLVRRDNVEHLLLIAGDHAQVVERGIGHEK